MGSECGWSEVWVALMVGQRTQHLVLKMAGQACVQPCALQGWREVQVASWKCEPAASCTYLCCRVRVVGAHALVGCES
jgi:hypothetical protein